jgi:hypothetical protein
MKILDKFLNLISFNMADCVIGSTPPHKFPANTCFIILSSDEYWNLFGCGQTNCKETPKSITPGRLWNLKFDFKHKWAGINESTGGSCPIPTVDQVPLTLTNFNDLEGYCTTVVTFHITTGGTQYFEVTAPGICEEKK